MCYCYLRAQRVFHADIEDIMLVILHTTSEFDHIDSELYMGGGINTIRVRARVGVKVRDVRAVVGYELV